MVNPQENTFAVKMKNSTDYIKNQLRIKADVEKIWNTPK